MAVVRHVLACERGWSIVAVSERCKSCKSHAEGEREGERKREKQRGSGTHCDVC